MMKPKQVEYCRNNWFVDLRQPKEDDDVIEQYFIAHENNFDPDVLEDWDIVEHGPFLSLKEARKEVDPAVEKRVGH